MHSGDYTLHVLAHVHTCTNILAIAGGWAEGGQLENFTTSPNPNSYSCFFSHSTSHTTYGELPLSLPAHACPRTLPADATLEMSEVIVTSSLLVAVFYLPQKQHEMLFLRPD